MSHNCFPGNNVAQRAESLVFCRCGAQARPGQRNCLSCHAAANRIYRAVREARADRARRHLSALRLAAITERVEGERT